jgi:hypothetical protein
MSLKLVGLPGFIQVVPGFIQVIPEFIQVVPRFIQVPSQLKGLIRHSMSRLINHRQV